MSLDSSYTKRLDLAIRFSDFIYVERWHNLCLDNQIFCATRVMELFNLTKEQAVGLQQDMVRAYKLAERISDVVEIIQQTHITVSSVISKNLPSTPKVEPTIEPPKIPKPPTTKPTEKLGVNVTQVIEYMNNEAGKCWGSSALRGTKVIDLANTKTTTSDIENLAYTMRQFNFSLDGVLVQGNNLGDTGIGALISSSR